MFSIFSRERKQLTSDIDTWVVRWKTYKYKYMSGEFPNVEKCYKAFTDKQEAYEYAQALNDAMKLLGITSLPEAVVYKQEVNSV